MGSSVSPSDPPPLNLRSDYSELHFRHHCLIFVQNCTPQGPKHPDRWRRDVVCRTVERKKELYKIFDERGDEVATWEGVIIHSAISDLHVTDAQYNFDCYTAFVAKQNIAVAAAAASHS